METRNLAPWNWFKNEHLRDGHSLQIELDRVFGYFSRDLDSLSNRLFKNDKKDHFISLPKVDISELATEYVIVVDLPGVKKEDLEIFLSKDEILTIRGKRESESEVKDSNYYHLERSHGSFERAIIIPKNCNLEEIKASFSDGVLKINLLKNKVNQAVEEEKRIMIN